MEVFGDCSVYFLPEIQKLKHKARIDDGTRVKGSG